MNPKWSFAVRIVAATFLAPLIPFFLLPLFFVRDMPMPYSGLTMLGSTALLGFAYLEMVLVAIPAYLILRRRSRASIWSLAAICFVASYLVEIVLGWGHPVHSVLRDGLEIALLGTLPPVLFWLIANLGIRDRPIAGRPPSRSQLLLDFGPTLITLAMVIVLAAWALLKSDPFQWRRENARDLAAFFRAHREAILQLGAITAADDAFFNEKGDLHINTDSPAERARFEALWKAAGRPNMSARVEPPLSGPPYPLITASMQFDYRWGGDDNEGPEWSEGIIYLQNGPEKFQQVVRDLDAVGKRPGAGYFLSRIEGPWYVLFYKFG